MGPASSSGGPRTSGSPPVSSPWIRPRPPYRAGGSPPGGGTTAAARGPGTLRPPAACAGLRVVAAAAELLHARRHLDAAEHVGEHQRLLPVDALVAERRVERAPAVVLVAPGDRVVAHRRRPTGNAVPARVIR